MPVLSEPARFPIYICGESERLHPMIVVLVLAKHWLPLLWAASDQKCTLEWRLSLFIAQVDAQSCCLLHTTGSQLGVPWAAQGGSQ